MDMLLVYLFHGILFYFLINNMQERVIAMSTYLMDMRPV